MAIYADGTREERSEDEDADHRKLLEEQAPELDSEGMWEEEFQKHVDSKTKYNSKHIFAIIRTVQHYEMKL